jgi:RsiW-degrading membrane proteinase PrsW (M82 family)
MEALRCLLLGFTPGLVWLLFIWRQDRFAPEPQPIVLRVFVLGGLSTVLVLLVRPWLDTFLPAEFATKRLLVDAYLVTAVVEELVKTAAMCGAVLYHREFDEPVDGIVYGAAAGLGFASVESALFAVLRSDPMLAILRGFTAALLHLICTGLAGYLIARVVKHRSARTYALAALGFLAAVALHGTYDALILAGSRTGRLAVAFVLPLVLGLFAIVLRNAIRESAARVAHP